jgi:hypothetical protein
LSSTWLIRPVFSKAASTGSARGIRPIASRPSAISEGVSLAAYRPWALPDRKRTVPDPGLPSARLVKKPTLVVLRRHEKMIPTTSLSGRP